MGVRDPILIWGAGAIGGTIGAYLVRAGHDVVFVDIVPEHVAAIRTTGLAIEGPIGEFAVIPSSFTPDELAGRFERALLCVKAQHTEDAMRALKPFVAERGYVVSMQNGLNELTISKVIGAERTIGAFINFGADYVAPGRILYGGRGAVVLGELDGRSTPRLAALHRVIQDFEPDAIVTANIWGYLWGKLGYGALLFATALTNESIAEALASPNHLKLYRCLAGEVMEIAAAVGVVPEGFNGFDPGAFVPDADPARVRRSIDAMVAHNRASAKSHSGIWRDLAVRKRKTEVDAQMAIIAEIAAQQGRTAPLTRRLIELIHDIEDGRREMSWTNLDLLAETVH